MAYRGAGEGKRGTVGRNLAAATQRARRKASQFKSSGEYPGNPLHAQLPSRIPPLPNTQETEDLSFKEGPVRPGQSPEMARIGEKIPFKDLQGPREDLALEAHVGRLATKQHHARLKQPSFTPRQTGQPIIPSREVSGARALGEAGGDALLHEDTLTKGLRGKGAFHDVIGELKGEIAGSTIKNRMPSTGATTEASPEEINSAMAEIEQLRKENAALKAQGASDEEIEESDRQLKEAEKHTSMVANISSRMENFLGKQRVSTDEGPRKLAQQEIAPVTQFGEENPGVMSEHMQDVATTSNANPRHPVSVLPRHSGSAQIQDDIPLEASSSPEQKAQIGARLSSLMRNVGKGPPPEPLPEEGAGSIQQMKIPMRASKHFIEKLASSEEAKTGKRPQPGNVAQLADTMLGPQNVVKGRGTVGEITQRRALPALGGPIQGEKKRGQTTIKKRAEGKEHPYTPEEQAARVAKIVKSMNPTGVRPILRGNPEGFPAQHPVIADYPATSQPETKHTVPPYTGYRPESAKRPASYRRPPSGKGSVSKAREKATMARWQREQNVKEKRDVEPPVDWYLDVKNKNRRG